MPLAEWSGEGAVEDQEHIRLVVKVREAEELAFVIRQGKIGGWGINAYLWHFVLTTNDYGYILAKDSRFSGYPSFNIVMIRRFPVWVYWLRAEQGLQPG